jgi:hypothetical protein
MRINIVFVFLILAVNLKGQDVTNRINEIRGKQVPIPLGSSFIFPPVGEQVGEFSFEGRVV